MCYLERSTLTILDEHVYVNDLFKLVLIGKFKLQTKWSEKGIHHTDNVKNDCLIFFQLSENDVKEIL